jgi:thioredoxin-related protein
MKRLLCFLVLVCVSVPFKGECLEWMTDAQAAQEKAKQENKFVLLDFTGSDWCGWCMKLKREVFDQPEFAGFAEDKLVMVEVDFPHRKVMSAAQIQANRALAKTYQVTGYPTIIVLDQDGHLAGQTGYMPGGPAAFDAKLDEFLKHKGEQPQPVAKTQPEEAPHKPAAFVPIPPAVPIHYGGLALKGISGTQDRRIVLINNADLMVGDTAKVKAENREVMVCCKEIRSDSVLITADGQPMELKLGQH